MSTVSKPPLLSPQEYLARERAADFRSEYFRGEIFAMAGARFEHTRIKDNVGRHAGNQLEKSPCQIVTSDLRVKVSATGLYTYPDGVIFCDEPQFEDVVRDTLLNPRTIIEVLSDSTEKYDRGAKFEHYQQVPSVQEYVLISQDRPLVERFVRHVDGNWLYTSVAGLAESFAFASVPVQIPLAEIYRGVTFPERVETPGIFRAADHGQPAK
jgi:Uma2 family endonuclease